MRIKFYLERDKIIYNKLTAFSIDLMIRLIELYLSNEISFNKLREYNPLYSSDNGRPNYILCGPGIYYVIKYSKSISTLDLSTNTDRFFWEVYNNPGPYQNNNNILMIERLKNIAVKSLNELKDSM